MKDRIILLKQFFHFIMFMISFSALLFFIFEFSFVKEKVRYYVMSGTFEKQLPDIVIGIVLITLILGIINSIKQSSNKDTPTKSSRGGFKHRKRVKQ